MSPVAHSPGAIKAAIAAAHDPIIVHNALTRPEGYSPYCMRCDGLERMRQDDLLLWGHECGAVHDEAAARAALEDVERRTAAPHPSLTATHVRQARNANWIAVGLSAIGYPGIAKLWRKRRDRAMADAREARSAANTVMNKGATPCT